MNLVRLEPGQLWHMSWMDNDSIVPGKHNRHYSIVLLRWDAQEKQWWILKTTMSGKLKYYPSAQMWNEEIVDLDDNHDSYSLVRLG